MTSPSSAVPAWVERVNALGVTLGGPQHLVSLDGEELLDTARAMTGLDDFGEGEWRTHFDILVRALEEESQLHLVGRTLTRHDLLVSLQNRLLLTQRWKANPGVLDAPIEAPVFIVGSARTGTTLLHELFDADPANRTPATWELYHPVQALGGEELRGPTDRAVRVLHSIDPEYGTMHTSAGDLPNECIFIALPMFLGEHWSGCHVVPTYEAHLSQAPQDEVYRFHRRFLQTIQQRLPQRRWVLKSPSHLGRLRTLFEVYPDARIIETHRDPLRTVPSMLSLVETLKRLRCSNVDLSGLPALLAAAVAAGYDEHIDDRRSGVLPEEAFIDLQYADLVNDPMGTMERLYTALGWQLTEAARQGMGARLAAPRHEGGAPHRYSLPEFGLDAATERVRFRSYQERFGVPDEV